MQCSVAQAGTSHVVVEVEPFVLPAGVYTEVGGEPNAVASMTSVAGRWGEEECTPPCTLAGHCWMKLSRPSSSCFPCERGSYHP
jgi:hypothetical protein